MNKGELATALLDESHRPDLSTKTDSFIRNAEGMIARRIRALDMLQRGTITDSDRTAVDEPTFNLATGCLEVRAMWAPTNDGQYVELEPKSLFEIRRLTLSANVGWYAMSGGNIVEFRGNPSSTLEIDYEYFGRPTALDLDADTTDLLTNHEEAYVSAGLFFLHRYTQDQDLAQGYLDSFREVTAALNESASRKAGAPSIAPVYNFSSGASY